MKKKPMLKVCASLMAFTMACGGFHMSYAYDDASDSSAAAAGEEAGIQSRTGVSQGINVNYHSQEDIRAYLAAHPVMLYEKETYAEEPSVKAPYAAGALSERTLNNALDTLNTMRYIAGIDNNITLNEEYSAFAQAAALVNAVNGGISHYPERPADMEETLYQLGYDGAGQSNLGWFSGSYQESELIYDIPYGWMDDGDEFNISCVGHRRWILNPAMKQTGFGLVRNDSVHTAMYSMDNAFGATSYYGVSWPAQNMPLDFWGTSYPWSISMGTKVPEGVQVTLTRARDGRQWIFSDGQKDGAFYVENSNYGKPGCIIFRPADIEGYEHGDSFHVEITGLSENVSYDVNFFSLEETDHTHTWDAGTVTEEATCTGTGEKIYRCGTCGESKTEQTPALGHDEEKSVTEATCTEAGEELTTCKRCKAELEKKVLEKLGHNWGEWTTVTEATWEEEGREERACTRCTEKEERSLPKLSESHEHDFTGKETIVKEATCTEDGSKEIACVNASCKEKKTEVIPALGHSEGEWKVVSEATCTEGGRKEKRCNTCGEELAAETLEKLGHNWGEWKTVKEAACTEDGSKEAACVNKSCAEKKTEVIPALGHSGEWKTVDKATCTEAGKEENVCSVCDKVLETKVVEKLGHDWTEFKTVKEATWEEAGQEERSCQRCTEKEVRELPKLSESHEHDFTGAETIVKEATCTEDGSREIACANENCTEKKTETIPALGHKDGEWKTVSEPGCTEAGKKEKACSVCGQVLETESINPLGHDWTEFKTVKEATWEEAGQEERSCQRCTEKEVRELPKLSESHEHDFTGAGTIVKEATCTEDGSREIACANENCTEKKTENIPALGHVEGEWKTVSEADCTKEGKAELSCSRCETVIKTKVVDVVGHTFTEWKVKEAATAEKAGLEERECTVCHEKEERELPKLSGNPEAAWENTDDKTGVHVSAGENVLPAETDLKVEEIGEGDALEKAKSALTETNKFRLFDISLWKDGVKIQPNGKIRISIPVPKEYNASRCKVYYIDEEGSAFDMNAKLSEASMVFEVNHLSNYAIAEMKETDNKDEETDTGNSSNDKDSFDQGNLPDTDEKEGTDYSGEKNESSDTGNVPDKNNPSGTNGTSGTPVSTKPASGGNTGKIAPKTGDSADLSLWVLMLGFSLVGMTVLYRKEKHNI